MKYFRRVVGVAFVAVMLVGMACQHPTASAYLAMAQAAQQQWEWDRAVVWYQAAATLDAGDAAPPLGIAHIRFWQGRFALAATSIHQAETYAPADAAVWLLAGDIAQAQHDAPTARTAWANALPLLPHAAAMQAADRLARQDLAIGQPLAALAITEQMPNPAPVVQFDAALAMLHLGQAAQAQAQLTSMPSLTSAQASYQIIAQNWRGTASDEAALGYADLAQGYPSLALMPLRAAVAMSPHYGEGQAYLAWALWSLGDLTQAQAALALAQRLAPDAASTVGIAALVAAQAGATQVALLHIEQWQAHHTPSTALWDIQAALAMQSGDPAAEEDARWQLATTAPPNDALNNQIALASFYLRTQLGRDDGRAAWAFAQMNAAALHNAIAADLAAQWDWQTGQPDDAISLLYHAVALDPGYAPAHRHLAAYATLLGDATTAALESDRAAVLGNNDNSGAE